MKKMTLEEMKTIKGSGCTRDYLGCNNDSCCVFVDCGGQHYGKVCGTINWYFSQDI